MLQLWLDWLGGSPIAWSGFALLAMTFTRVWARHGVPRLNCEPA